MNSEMAFLLRQDDKNITSNKTFWNAIPHRRIEWCKNKSPCHTFHIQRYLLHPRRHVPVRQKPYLLPVTLYRRIATLPATGKLKRNVVRALNEFG